jgi:predicted secreted protein
MAEVGHEVAVYVLAGSAGDSAPANLAAFTAGEVGGIESASFSRSRTQLDRTDFKDTEEVKKRFSGLKDGNISFSGFLDLDDPDGQDEIEAAFEGDKDSILWVNIIFGTGYARLVECTVESFEVSAEVDGRVEWSCSINFSGAVAAGKTS